MRRTSGWVSIAFASLVAGVLIGSVVAGFLYYSRGLARHVASGESSYQSGLRAVRDNQLVKAQVYFHEAILSVDNLLQKFEDPQGEPKPQEQFEKEQRLIGRAYWIKHRAIKARGFTKLLIDNKPLPVSEGQSEGTADQMLQKLSALRLPEEESRREALICLREAAYRLPAAAEVLREAVATEIQIEPMQWNHVHAFATTLAEIDPNDERALYLLARLEYEQPVAMKADTGRASMPMPSSRRSKDRMLKGLDLVNKLKTKESPIRWRTSFLEAQMYSWLMQYFRQPGQLKPEAEQDARKHLHAVLLDRETGIIGAVQKQESVGIVSRLDIQGLYGMHQLALDLVIEGYRRAVRNPGFPETHQHWLEELQIIMDASVALSNKLKTNGRSTEAAEFLAQACLKSLPCLIPQRLIIWEGYRDQALDLAKQARSDNRLGQTLSLRMADLLTCAGLCQEKTNSLDAARRCYQDAVQWIDDGLKIATENKVITPVALSLHEAKLRLLEKQFAPFPVCQPHLEALSNSKHDDAIAAAAYYEGSLAEREGRLQFARGLLEKASRSNRNDLSRRVLAKLVSVYLSLEMPDQALAAIKSLTRMIGQQTATPEDEPSRINDVARGAEELLLLRVRAHLLAADQAQQLQKADSVSTKQLQATVVHHEGEVKQLIELGSKNTFIRARMQLAWAQYLLQYDRLQEAESHIIVLNLEHPEWLETLRLQIGFTLHQAQPGLDRPEAPLPNTVVQKVDHLIQQYLARTQAQPGGKLIWLKWLATTGRAEVMEKLINDKVFLGDASHDGIAKRLRALAHLYVETREPAHELLKAIPVDPQVEQALLQTAHTLCGPQQTTLSSSGHDRDAGLARVWSAALALVKGDYADACHQYVSCMEYAKVRPLVRQGLIEALIGWAQLQPLEARKLAVEALQKYSSDSSLLLGYAYASMLLGELGNPADAGDQVKDMATALKAFEAACQIEHREPAFATWIETQCWLLSPRHDLALMHALRTLECNPKHEAAYCLAIQLLLDKDGSSNTDQAQRLASAFRTNLPRSIESLYWQARCYDQLGRANDALALYRELMEQSPRHCEVYPATCRLLLSSASDESRAACQQVLNRWKAALPNDVRAWQMEVQYFANQNKINAARATVEQVLSSVEVKVIGESSIQTVSTEKQQQLSVKKADMLCLLAQSLVKSKQSVEAGVWVNRALELFPDHEAAQMLLGELLMEQMCSQPVHSEARRRLAQEGAAAFSKVYRRHQGHLQAGNKLAWLLASELKDPEEAYRIVQELRAAKFYTRPMTGDMLPLEMLDTLGLVYSRLPQTEFLQERIQVFEAARRRYSDEPRVALYLAQGYLAAGDGKGAMVVYQAALTLLPKSTLPFEVQRILNQEIQEGMAAAQGMSR